MRDLRDEVLNAVCGDQRRDERESDDSELHFRLNLEVSELLIKAIDRDVCKMRKNKQKMNVSYPEDVRGRKSR